MAPIKTMNSPLLCIYSHIDKYRPWKTFKGGGVAHSDHHVVMYMGLSPTLIKLRKKQKYKKAKHDGHHIVCTTVHVRQHAPIL